MPPSETDLPLPHDIGKAGAVSMLASRAGVAIGNPWYSITVGEDIRRIAEAISPLANTDVRFASHRDVPNARELPIYSTPPRPFPAPGFANRRHDVFAGIFEETYLSFPSQFNILTLSDSYICHYLEAPIVVAADGTTVVRDYSSNYAGLVHFHPRPLADCLADARYIDGVVVPIADDVQTANISHWICDWLPRLAFLGPRVRDPDVFIVTSAIASDFQREALRLLGIGSDRVIPLANFAAVRARELIVPSHLGNVFHPGFVAAPWALSFLQSTLGLGALREAAPAGGRSGKIYVSRSDAKWRRVLNEPDLTAALAAAGYREVVLSALPLVEQIAIFARATHVVGLHGAGLTHFLFAPSGARLLEILPQSYAIPTFYILAAGGGNAYLSYVADRIVPGPANSLDDVEIDVADFAAHCRRFYE